MIRRHGHGVGQTRAAVTACRIQDGPLISVVSFMVGHRERAGRQVGVRPIRR
jgi:hypothetical protein